MNQWGINKYDSKITENIISLSEAKFKLHSEVKSGFT